MLRLRFNCLRLQKVATQGCPSTSKAIPALAACSSSPMARLAPPCLTENEPLAGHYCVQEHALLW